MKASPLTASAQVESPNKLNGFVVSDDAVAAVQTAFRTSGTSSLRVASSCEVPQRAMFSDPRVHPHLAHMYYDFGWLRQNRAGGVVT